MISKKHDRRNFIKATGAGLAAMCATGPKVFDSVAHAMSRNPKNIPVGLQLYSVRDDCRKDFAGAVTAVAKMGYEGVEFAGYYDYTAKDLRKLLDDNGLKCSGTHIGLQTLQGDELEPTIEYNAIIGNKYLIVPSMQRDLSRTADGWRKAAAIFNEVSEKLKPHGMMVGFHNHAVEFQPVDGEVPWDILFGNTNDDVIIQIDVGHAFRATGNPLPHMQRYPGRMITVHLKEHSETNRDALFGEGDVDWDVIFEFCESDGNTEWYIIEQESYPDTPMESVRKCLANFRAMGK